MVDFVWILYGKLVSLNSAYMDPVGRESGRMNYKTVCLEDYSKELIRNKCENCST